jgi:8-oxo-dGTP pyrophosphatase MutT (NUDIX family)
VPKGWPTKGLSPPEVAAREAYEEAGLQGVVEADVFGRFCYDKRLSGGATIPCEVDVFLMHVEIELDDWPERAERERRWVRPDEAARLIREAGLIEMMLRLAATERLEVLG